ncbi:hypothetical protein M0805_001469 [Coniferiporia weirii]|nr:hypothetical protein M0805_001469 [Coniferiporia weirii]
MSLSLQIFADASDVMVLKYTTVATAALCVGHGMFLDYRNLVLTVVTKVYEFFLTLDSEVRLVWPSRFNSVKVLFLANRYLPFIITFSKSFCESGAGDSRWDTYTPLSPKLCKPQILALGFASVVGFIFAEVVLAMRVLAIWKGKRAILILMTFLIGLLPPIASPITLFRSGCEIIALERTEWIIILVVFLFEIVILALVIVARKSHRKGSQSAREAKLTKSHEVRELSSGLAGILVKDGIFYCICVMVISLVNVFVVKLAPAILSPFLVVYVWYQSPEPASGA